MRNNILKQKQIYYNFKLKIKREHTKTLIFPFRVHCHLLMLIKIVENYPTFSIISVILIVIKYR